MRHCGHAEARAIERIKHLDGRVSDLWLRLTTRPCPSCLSQLRLLAMERGTNIALLDGGGNTSIEVCSDGTLRTIRPWNAV
jgi:hypothetical protein